MRGLRLLGAALSLAAPGLPSAIHGQVPFETCRDRDNRIIPGVVDNGIGYAGLADQRDGRPVIVWNARSNRHLSHTEQVLIYLHECAHHRLGHLYAPGDDPRYELEADCWAIQRMADRGMAPRRHLAALERARRVVRGDRAHLGGEARLRSLRWCLEVRTDRKAWAAALNTLVRAAADGFVSSRGRALDTLEVPPAYQSRLGTPGTYDCEVVGAAIRCLVFDARSPGAAGNRYGRLVRILTEWLPPGWTSIQRTDPELGNLFLAQDGTTGTLVTLARHGVRIHFLVKRSPI